MKRRSYVFSFLKGIFFLGLFVFVALLYWSYYSLELQVLEIKKEIEQLEVQAPQKERIQTSSHIKSDRPNLLSDDPFYLATLPKMLGNNFSPQGSFRSSIVGRPPDLHPFSNWSMVNGWRSLCGITVATNHFGIFESLAPMAATRMEQRGEEFWVFLRSDLFWEPIEVPGVTLAPHFKKRHPVTAHDFKFFYDAMMNPFVEEAGAVALRTYYSDIEEVRVIDDYTFAVKWRTHEGKVRYAAKQLTGGLRPLASFVYQYFPSGEKILAEGQSALTSSVWAQNFANHFAKNVIVSCGPWIFQEKTDSQIVLNRNPRFFSPLRALMEERVTLFKSNPTGPWQDFKGGLIDTVTLQPDELIEWEEFLKSNLYQEQVAMGKGAERLDYLVRSYSYIGWNEKTPFFENKRVRQAMTMAIDRERIIGVILNGMGVEISGPFFVGSPSYDSSITPWPFDPKKAKEILEQEGWYDRTDDGIRDQNGVKFSFSLTYYVKNQITRSVCEFIATSLKKIGIECKLNGVDITDLSKMFDEKSFDAISLGWGLGSPPEDPRQLWSSAGADQKGSSNAIGFSNARVDEIINALDFTYDPDERIKLYHEFHQIIHEEAPYTFLYTPKAAFVYREYVKNVWIPSERQELIPGANIPEPQSEIFWLDD